MKKNSIAKKIAACSLVAGTLFTLTCTALPEGQAAGLGLMSRAEAAESKSDDDGWYCGPHNGRGRRWRGGCCGRYNGQDRPCWDDGNNKE